MPNTDTANRLLDTAQVLVQRRGYNAFSYKDLAEEIGIRTASIHYHFKSKADLGKALVERYLDALQVTLDDIERQESTAKGQLTRFIDLYRATEAKSFICLCGSMASDYTTLPESVQQAVSEYLEHSEAWVARTLTEGVRTGEFFLDSDPADTAATLVASLQGGLIVSRASQGSATGPRPSILDTVQRTFLDGLKAP